MPLSGSGGGIPVAVVAGSLDDDIRARLAQGGLTPTLVAVDGLATGRPPASVVLLAGATPSSATDLAQIPRAARLTAAPLVAVVAADRLGDRVVAFTLGAADVLAAPYDPDELVIRIRVLAGRGRPIPTAEARPPAIVVDLDARQVTVAGEPVPLANREFELLAHLAAHPGRAFTRHELLEAVWGSSAQWQDPATVTEHVRRIRAQLTRVAGGAGSLQTVRRHGYRFVPPALPPAPARPAEAGSGGT